MAARPDSSSRLLGDIGGTNARFGWQQGEGAEVTDVIALPGDEHPSLAAAMHEYLRRVGRAAPPACAIGIANPINGDHVQMTNRDWSFSIQALKQEFGFDRLVVINDFTALALALPVLAPEQLHQVGGDAAQAGAPIALIGPGTGLGVSGLVPGPMAGTWIPLQGEGGHITLGSRNAREAGVLRVLQQRFGHASAERAVSGPGLEAVHDALGDLDGVPSPIAMAAPEITAHALAGSDARCVEAIALFCSFLGNAAGNLALTLGARGGVYIGGGIVPRLGDAFARSDFRAAFEDKGRFRSYLASIPVFVIDANVSPALLGVSRAL